MKARIIGKWDKPTEDYLFEVTDDTLGVPRRVFSLFGNYYWEESGEPLAYSNADDDSAWAIDVAALAAIDNALVRHRHRSRGEAEPV